MRTTLKTNDIFKNILIKKLNSDIEDQKLKTIKSMTF